MIVGYILAHAGCKWFSQSGSVGCKPSRSFTGQHKDILYSSRHLHSDIADNVAMPWKATDAMKERMSFVL